mgnify:CR=1 FL=1
MTYNWRMNIYIKTTPAFDRKAEKLLSKDALEEFYDYIGENPELGKIIPGTSGVRKIRWKTGLNDKGKVAELESCTIIQMI